MPTTFGVITRVGTYPGNHAVCGELLEDAWLDGQFLTGGQSKQLTSDPSMANLILAIRTPVFKVGEILIMGLDGREVTGDGRKPSKWDVTCEEFDNVEAAITRAREVGGF